DPRTNSFRTSWVLAGFGEDCLRCYQAPIFLIGIALSHVRRLGNTRHSPLGYNVQPIKVSKSMRTLPKYLTQDELTRFFKAITSPPDRALFGLSYHYAPAWDEPPVTTVHDIDLNPHRTPPPRLKNGVGGERSLCRHTAKSLRAYMRVRIDAGAYLFTGR